MTRPPLPAVKRRSAEQTRELLIDLGITMLHERGAAAGVTHVKLADVVDRAGLTTGAAYRLWDDQPAFHRDLAIAAVRWRDRTSTENTLRHIEEVLRMGGPWQELVRRGAEANLHQFPDDIAFLTTLALRASAHGNPELVAASHDRHLASMEAYGELYEAMLTTYQRCFKPCFTLDHLCAALAALAEGFGVQAASGEEHPRVHVTSDDDRVGTVWSLLGIAAAALIEYMTEPCPAAEPPAG